MDVSQARCASCSEPMRITHLVCDRCEIGLDGSFEIPPLARLTVEDQIFVVAFVRHHGSIKQMERLFGVSYPTIKNRLNRITAALDEAFNVPTSGMAVLEALERGDIDLDEALRRLEE